MPYAKDPEDNLSILEAMVDEMRAYLESDDLYRQVVVQTPDETFMPKMTIGLMLDHYTALERELPTLLPREKSRVSEALDQFEEIRDTHTDAYADKLRREMKSHLDSWSWYLDGCVKGDDDCAENYPSEAWLRTRLESLMQEARGQGLAVQEQAKRLSQLDEQLEKMFQPGDYVGPEGWQDEYPEGRYWWLFGRPAME